MIKQILYSSVASDKLTPECLSKILTKARINNAKHDVTGLLIYGDGAFMQVIEGTHDTIDTLYANIVADKMHNNIRHIYTKDIPNRIFSEWQMGFSPLSEKITGEDVLMLCEQHIDELSQRNGPSDLGIFMRAFYDVSVAN